MNEKYFTIPNHMVYKTQVEYLVIFNNFLSDYSILMIEYKCKIPFILYTQEPISITPFYHCLSYHITLLKIVSLSHLCNIKKCK